jgi:hypothetical protein
MIPLHPAVLKSRGPEGIIPPGGVWGSAPFSKFYGEMVLHGLKVGFAHLQTQIDPAGFYFLTDTYLMETMPDGCL